MNEISVLRLNEFLIKESVMTFGKWKGFLLVAETALTFTPRPKSKAEKRKGRIQRKKEMLAIVKDAPMSTEAQERYR